MKLLMSDAVGLALVARRVLVSLRRDVGHAHVLREVVAHRLYGAVRHLAVGLRDGLKLRFEIVLLGMPILVELLEFRLLAWHEFDVGGGDLIRRLVAYGGGEPHMRIVAGLLASRGGRVDHDRFGLAGPPSPPTRRSQRR